MNVLILFVGHCDLYFVVQCFCLVSLTLSYRNASYMYLKYLFTLQSDTMNGLIRVVGHCDLFHGPSYMSVHFLIVRVKLP